MEAVDFRGALLRRWWLLVVIGIVGALLGVVLQPGHAKASTSQKWTTIATVGIAPQITVSRGIGVNTTATVQEIVFYAHEASVISAAAQVAGIKEPVSQLESAVIIYGPTKGTQGEVALGTVADSPSESAAFSNAVVAQLGIYLDNLAKSSQQLALAAAQQKVALLEKSISGSPKASANLSAQLSAALAQVQELSGPPQTGYSVLQPASAATAVAEGTKSSGIKSSPLTAGAIGFVLGLLVGAAIVIQMAMFDKGLRTAKRAENAFGFRVIAEIPAPQPVGPDGTDHSKSDPAMSAYLEAYRKLCMSVFLGELPLRAPEQESGYGFLEVRHGPESSSPGNGGSSISSLRPGDQALMKGRQVVLVASAGPDPSRSIVVKELAAACAGGVARRRDEHDRVALRSWRWLASGPARGYHAG